jgi:GNAT superfamily N-acetyltransferase
LYYIHGSGEYNTSEIAFKNYIMVNNDIPILMEQTEPTDNSERILIRYMAESDLDVVTDLWMKLIEEHAANDPLYFASFRNNRNRKRRHLEIILRDSFEQAWVAVHHYCVIGFCSAFVSYAESMYNRRTEATLGDIYVEPAYRSRGVGSLLLRETMEWAKLMEADDLRLHVHSANRDAIAYYEGRGFRHKFRVMSLAL